MMNRRALLRCLGGALSLPVLEACQRAAPERVGASASPVVKTPAKRFIGMGVFNGVVPRLWYPSGTESNFTLNSMMQGLEDFQSNLLILKGVDNVAAEKTAGTNGHAEGVNSLFSGWSPREAPVGSNTWHGQGQSVDQAIAQGLTQQGVLTRFGSLPLITQGGGSYGGLSFAGKEQEVNAVGSPDDLFNLMFQDQDQSAKAIQQARARRLSVLDGSIADYTRLSSRVSGEDKRRIDGYLQALRELEMRLAAGASCDPSGKKPGLTAPSKDLVVTAFLDMMVLAFTCDLTRVFTFSFDHAGGGGTSFPWLGINDDWHELSHQAADAEVNRNGAQVGSGTDKFVKVHQWWAGRIKYLLQQLNAVTTPEGTTLLDETVLVRGSELGLDHTHIDVPLLIAAGKNTPLRAGRYLNLTPERPLYIDGAQSNKVYPGGVPHNNFLVTLLHAFGLQGDTFGDPAICTGNLDAAILGS